TATGVATAALPPLPFALLSGLAATAPGFIEAFLASEGDESLARGFPAARVEGLPSFAKGFFLATGFPARRNGDFLAEGPDLAKTDFFFAGFFVTALTFDGLPERFVVRSFGATRFAAALERGLTRLAFAFALMRDFFKG